MTELAIDLASIKNVPVEEAFAKIRSGIAGVIRPLRNWGFSLSAAEVKQVAFATGLTKIGKEMTEQEKQMARMVLLLHKTRQVHGDMARTMNSAANMWRAFNTAITDTKKLAGFEALPGFERLLSVLVALTEKGAPFRASMQEVGQALGTMANTAAQGLTGWVNEYRRVGRIAETTGNLAVDAPVAGLQVAEGAARGAFGALAGLMSAVYDWGVERERKSGLRPGFGAPNQSRAEFFAGSNNNLEALAERGRQNNRLANEAEAAQDAKEEWNLANTTMLGGGASMGFGAMGGLGVGSAALPAAEMPEEVFTKEEVGNFKTILESIRDNTKPKEE